MEGITMLLAHLKAALLLLGTLLLGAVPCLAQDVVVQSGNDSVIVDGDTVRINDGESAVTVNGDWRKRGVVLSPSQAGRVVVELGGVAVDDRIQLNLAGDILFDFDSTQIKPAAAATLAKVAQLIRARSVGRIQVIGHTDSKGTAAYNQKLSRARAAAVMRHLNAVEGIPGSVMLGSGVGAKYPVAYNTLPNGTDNPQGRAQNRRVEIQIATREGVALGPGKVTVEAGRVTTPEAVVDANSVSTDEAQIDISTGAVLIRDADSTVSAAAAAPKASERSAATSGSDACQRLCAATAGAHDMDTIGCVESVMEEADYDMDSESCDDLEEAMLLGSGNAGGKLCRTCQDEQGFGEAQCADALRECFP